MSDACGIHEEFMNEYVLILSRVGGGVRVRGGLGVGVSIQDQSFGLTLRPVFDVTVGTDSTGYWLWSQR